MLNENPPSRSNRRLLALVACVSAAIVLLGTVLVVDRGWFLLTPGRVSGVANPTSVDPGWATLKGVTISYTYRGTTQPYGPGQQEGCMSCPIQIRGGSTISFPFMTLSGPNATGITTYWVNASSPVPFEEFGCYYPGSVPPAGWPTHGCPYTTTYVGGEIRLGAGNQLTFFMNLTVPDPAATQYASFSVSVSVGVAT